MRAGKCWARKMVDLIRRMHRWLRPAAADTPEKAHDTSSMADLVRLLGTEREPPGAAEGRRDKAGNDADRHRPGARH